MKFIICLKQVPDTEIRVKFLPDGQGVDLANTKWIINPYDEYAIEEALRLKESFPGSVVTVVSVGPQKRVCESLRMALAMGVDEAVVIDAPAELDSLSTATLLAEAIRRLGFDVILAGKSAIDDNASSVGPMLAEKLHIPHATVVSKLQLVDKELWVECDLDCGQKATVSLKIPALITTNKGLNLPRYASLPGIMKAKKKAIQEYSLEQLGFDSVQVKMRFYDYSPPAERPKVTLITSTPAEQAKTLVKLLREEAKII